MRESGILMHISSLPSEFGIGTFGKEAYRFVDFLKKGGQKYWQVLPMCPVGAGNSPYQSVSCFAGNPLFIDLEKLEEEGLIKSDDYKELFFGEDKEKVDFEALFKNKMPVLFSAAKEFLKNLNEDYKAFCNENFDWLENFALFSAISDKNGYGSFKDWDKSLLKYDLKAINNFITENEEEIELYKIIQYFFFKQWDELKKYANENEISIIGDIPIYVSPYSSDVWSSPLQFSLDEELEPTYVAGVPPDAFAADGQLWGNPIYNWSYMKKDGYSWWISRIKNAFKVYDMVRIDHFRGFESYYRVKNGEKTAINGNWVKGPGAKLFALAERELGKLPIIAEDLGIITDEVKEMLKETGYPGMKVLQFAFDSREENDYLPHNYNENSVVYTGTHDNNTIIGWFSEINEADKHQAINYMRLTKEEGYNFGMMKTALASKSKLCILTMQDLLGLGSEGRMNVPGTPSGNWIWRIKGECINDWLAGILFDITKTYSR